MMEYSKLNDHQKRRIAEESVKRYEKEKEYIEHRLQNGEPSFIWEPCKKDNEKRLEEARNRLERFNRICEGVPEPIPTEKELRRQKKVEQRKEFYKRLTDYE